MIFGDIYIITNLINGKKYVGQSRNQNGGYLCRWADHVRCAFNDSSKKYKINHAIKKYGVESFRIDLMERINCATLSECIERLDKLEVRYIKEFDTYNNGYNSTKGGQSGGFDIDPALKCKSVTQYSMDGVPVAEFKSIKEASTVTGINGISVCCKGRVDTAGGFIWRHGAGLRQLESQCVSKAIESYERIHGTLILEFGLDGKLISEHPSIKSASETLGIKANRITDCCKGNKKTVSGRIFLYKRENKTPLKAYTDRVSAESVRLKGFSVSQYTLSGEFVASFPSYRAAESSLSITSKNIGLCISGKCKSVNGFIWVKTGDTDRLSSAVEYFLVGGSPCDVYQYTLDGAITGKYRSSREASIKTGFNKGLITDCLSGFKKTHKGYIWSKEELEFKTTQTK